MHGFLATLLCAALAIAACASPAPANSAITQRGSVASTPRSYPEIGTPRADPGKPAQQSAREQAQADADDAACAASDAAACARLGTAFERGAGRPQNRPVAELLYRRACNAAVGAACFALAELVQIIDTPADQEFAAVVAARACLLGSLDGCNVQADNLATGVLGPPDLQAAETLRRAACDRGGLAACVAIATEMIGDDRTTAEQDNGRALLDQHCRSGDLPACETAVSHWRHLDLPGAEMRLAQYLQLGCAAASASSCSDLGLREVAMGKTAAHRTAALALYDRACLLDRRAWTACRSATNLREEPRLTAQCANGEYAACTALGAILTETGSPLEDRLRALTLLGSACELGADTGASSACLPAAILVFDRWDTGDAASADQAQFYLERGCTGGDGAACTILADELASGARLPQDRPRAAMLYVTQCDAGSSRACGNMEDLARGDPASPLVLASANFGPELTPDEEAQERQQRRQQRERERAEINANRCTATTVIFEGASYTDTVCDDRQVRVIGLGFSARAGEAPWQALLWRPEVLDGTRLTLAQRVKCGGAVIRDGWILTAAHCLTDEGGVSIAAGGHRVRLGLNNPLSDEGFSYPIMQVIPHPDFKRKPLAFDIALVRFDPRRGERVGGPVIVPARIRLDPLMLDQRKLSAVQRVVTYGWGITKVGTGQIPDHLRGARLTLRDTAACTADTRFEDAKRRDSFICADDTKAAEGGQACSGDSGGPLITYGDADKVPTVIGVVSGGVECGTLGRPSRYVRIAHPLVRRWLRSHVPGFGTR